LQSKSNPYFRPPDWPLNVLTATNHLSFCDTSLDIVPARLADVLSARIPTWSESVRSLRSQTNRHRPEGWVDLDSAPQGLPQPGSAALSTGKIVLPSSPSNLTRLCGPNRMAGDQSHNAQVGCSHTKGKTSARFHLLRWASAAPPTPYSDDGTPTSNEISFWAAYDEDIQL